MCTKFCAAYLVMICIPALPSRCKAAWGCLDAVFRLHLLLAVPSAPLLLALLSSYLVVPGNTLAVVRTLCYIQCVCVLCGLPPPLAGGSHRNMPGCSAAPLFAAGSAGHACHRLHFLNCLFALYALGATGYSSVPLWRTARLWWLDVLPVEVAKLAFGP